ncbi:MAG: Nif3-like dinuclear metal center hexameric protein [Bacteroidales bacterium]|nr:Nif3-like dinuclear metal center hexameric protein [Bacteroidales bacterium]
MKIKEVTDYLDGMFHPEYQEEYDNSGFLFGEAEADYRGALVAVDLTEAVVAEAVELGMNLVVTHHPFLFGGVKRLTSGTAQGRMVMALARAGISVYAAHTNLDNLPEGVNGVLAEVLGISEGKVLKPLKGHEDIGAGMVGMLASEVDCDEYLQLVKSRLGLPLVRTSPHEANRKVKRVAICGGSGAFLIGEAIAAKADLYMTADLKYHDFQRAEGQLVLADIGHYESEQFAKEIIFRTVSNKFSNFACRISGVQGSIVSYI